VIIAEHDVAIAVAKRGEVQGDDILVIFPVDLERAGAALVEAGLAAGQLIQLVEGACPIEAELLVFAFGISTLPPWSIIDNQLS